VSVSLTVELAVEALRVEGAGRGRDAGQNRQGDEADTMIFMGFSCVASSLSPELVGEL
jgi:hypothetical protein